MFYGAIQRNVVNFDTETDIPDLAGKVIFITGGLSAPSCSPILLA